MFRIIRNGRIYTKGRILAAAFLLVAFASAPVYCMTHGHCSGTRCFAPQQRSHDSHDQGSCRNQERGVHSHDDTRGCLPTGCSCVSDASEEHDDADRPCKNRRSRHDMHHHSPAGYTPPQKKITAPALGTPSAETPGDETPILEISGWVTDAAAASPLEKYGLTFSERAPPY